MRALRKTTAVMAAAILSFSTLAAEGDVAPTLEASGTRAAGVVTVTGTASAGTVTSAASVGGLLTSHDGGAASSQAGLQLVDGLISQDENGLTFSWVVDNLHGPALPEGVRYNWSFLIGDQSFQLQAKSTNIASVTLPDDPAGHFTNAGASFQVRGNCTADWMGTGVANCPHIGWADGSFDAANNMIHMTLPYGFHELLQPGAVLVAHDSAGMSIAASGQAVISNANTSSYINGWSTYAAGLAVFVSAGFDDDDPAKLRSGQAVELAEDGSFTVDVEVEDDEVVWVRACTGYVCTAQMVG